MDSDSFDKRRSLSKKANFRLSASFMQELFVDARSNGLKGGFGLKDSLWTAYIWKLVTVNRPATMRVATFSQVYNSRSLLGLSKNFFGNAGIFPFFHIENDRLRNIPIEAIAKDILSLRNKAFSARDSLCRSIALWDSKLSQGKLTNYWPMILKYLMRGEVLINNLSKLPFYDFDFGTGPPVWVDFPDRDKSCRNIHVLPAPEKNGDLLLFVTLPEAELNKFFQDSSILAVA